MQLQRGQVAVVTGAASGIGLALAEAFVERGLGVLLADVEADALALVEQRLRDTGADVEAMVTDVRSRSAVEALAARALERFGRIDVVCNNAGVSGVYAASWELDPTDWQWVLEVNLNGVINGIAAFVPHLVAQGSGHVVNTASMAGLIGAPFLGPYTAAKHAVVGLSEGLAAELALRSPGVGVTVLCPGVVRTRIREAERNRPDELTPASAPTARLASPEPAGAPRTVLEPSAVAAQTLDAIEQGRLHVVTHPDLYGAVRDRVQHLLSDLV